MSSPSHQVRKGRPQPAGDPALKKKKRIRLWSAGVLLAVLAGVFAQYPLIWITDQKDGEFLVSEYTMREDDFKDPRLQTLRRREHLDEVVAPGKTQFDKIVLLRHWAHMQWQTKTPFYYPPWNALEILDLARTYHNNGFCAQYAVVFLQACQSLGLHARYVELWGHFIVGVWSDDYDRWVLMDPTYDWHYEKDGSPLRGGDLLKAYWTKKIEGILRVSADGTRMPVKREDLAIYRMYSIITEADQLFHPVLIWINEGQKRSLVHEADFRRYPLIGRDRLSIESPYLAWQIPDATEFFNNKPMTEDPDNFRYRLNQTIILPARRYPATGTMKLVLLSEDPGNGVPAFSFTFDNWQWQKATGNTIAWKLQPGTNTIQARIQTPFGWQGPISSIEVFYKPRWFHWKDKPFAAYHT
jgi:hypothetical protein